MYNRATINQYRVVGDENKDGKLTERNAETQKQRNW